MSQRKEGLNKSDAAKSSHQNAPSTFYSFTAENKLIGPSDRKTFYKFANDELSKIDKLATVR